MISLNIYKADNKKEVEKTYKAESYDLMFGTVEEFMRVIDLDKIGDNGEVAKMVVKGFSQINPLLHDVFPELTDEELQRTKVSDIVQTILQIAVAVAENLKELNSGNLRRG
jgi:hypothetical protein